MVWPKPTRFAMRLYPPLRRRTSPCYRRLVTLKQMSNLPADPRASQSHSAVYRKFSQVAWGVLGYNLLVVLWGAIVRATGSGAGCGERWPLCNGVMLPRVPRIETVIEFTHRASSGLALAGVAALCLWAFRLFPRGHQARRFAALSVVFLFCRSVAGGWPGSASIRRAQRIC